MERQGIIYAFFLIAANDFCTLARKLLILKITVQPREFAMLTLAKLKIFYLLL